MGVAIDFVVSAEDFIWREMGDLSLIAPRQYRPADHFYEDTLVVFVNGVRVEQQNDDGFTIIDDETFEMKETYPAQTRISCGYVKKEV